LVAVQLEIHNVAGCDARLQLEFVGTQVHPNTCNCLVVTSNLVGGDGDCGCNITMLVATVVQVLAIAILVATSLYKLLVCSKAVPFTAAA
jgi:hypothetical protein